VTSRRLRGGRQAGINSVSRCADWSHGAVAIGVAGHEGRLEGSGQCPTAGGVDLGS
jgi:hypothetical protein